MALPENPSTPTSTASKMTLERATDEIKDWLDYKGIDLDDEDDEQAKTIKSLAKRVKAGLLVVNDDKSITHHLKFPIGKDEDIKELKYRARIRARDFEMKAKNAKTSSPMSFVHAKIAAIAAINSEVVRNMDMVDYNVAQDIAGFF